MTNLRLINLLIAALFCAITASAATLPKRKYPGGKCYIWRYTLQDKVIRSTALSAGSRTKVLSAAASRDYPWILPTCP